MAPGFAVNTTEVDIYIGKVKTALELLKPVQQMLTDHDPQTKSSWLEDLAGKASPHSGGPQDFHRACEGFVRESVQLYREILEKFALATGNLETVVSAGSKAMAAYRQRDQEAADILNKLLQNLD
ncbi:hypothetical protein [Amycolatopsis anabasis]|uniref:hypothetical protein n=1 Tax=Amycolatopsis anabasis TaxID=1840409 RepID=UPI00131D8D03|nr:hypothetical protein [Amycolatopsis anabasis]